MPRTARPDGLAPWPGRWPLLLVAVALPVGLALRGEFLLGVPGAGGGAFLVAFLALFFLVALPLVAVELALGRLARASGGASLARGLEACAPRRGARFVGLLALPIALLGLGATTYLGGASLHYAFASFAGRPVDVLPSEVAAYWAGYTGAERNEWFDGVGAAWGFWFGAFVLVTVLVGVRSAVPRLVPWAFGAFAALQVVLLVRVLTLDPSVAGSDRLGPLFEPEWAALREFDTWSRAAAAALLVPGVGLGVFPALGARLGERDDVVGRGFAITAFALAALVALVVVPSLLVVGQLGADELGNAAADPSSFAFVSATRAWQLAPSAEAWAGLWFVGLFLGFALAAVAFAQPLLSFAADLGKDHGAQVGWTALAAFAVGQLAVFRAGAGFLAEEAAVARQWGVPVLLAAELVYFVGLVRPARLIEDLRVGAVLGVPDGWRALLAVVAPLVVVASLTHLAGAVADHTFALGAVRGGTATLLLTRGAVVAVVVLGLLAIRDRSAPLRAGGGDR